MEIKTARELGKPKNETGLFILAPCEKCGKERWIRKRAYDKGMHKLCMSCCQIGKKQSPELKAHKSKLFTGEGNPAWSGGRHHGGCRREYIVCWISPDDFFYPMAFRVGKKKKMYVLEHRLIMAKHLNRCLLPWEVVHHKNGIKDDNRLENLELIKDRNHLVDQKTKSYITSLQDRIKQLEAKVNH